MSVKSWPGRNIKDDMIMWRGLYIGSCELHQLERKEKWYEHELDGVVENGEVKPLWDMNSQCDNVVKARRPDMC